MSDARSSKLRSLFFKVLSGEQDITTTNAKLFIEAVCSQPEPATCIQRLIGNVNGFSALQSALRTDISVSFLNGPITGFLRYIQAPELKSICGGDVLQQVISGLVEQPLVWDALIKAIKSNDLSEEGVDGFSWLLLMLVSRPTEKALAYSNVVREGHVLSRLLESPRLDVRNRAHRIKHIVDTITTSKNPETGGPGGRHDNDFSDIRKIAILPTPDELASKDPFLRRAVEIHEDRPGSRTLARHIDSQFRLLREDMLRDLREEIQIDQSNKQGRRRAVCIDHLSLSGVLSDERRPWSLQLQCVQDLPQLHGMGISARKKFVRDHPMLLKDQSVACLMTDQEVIGLATVIREEDLLAQIPPVLCLRISDGATEKTLLRLKNAKTIRLVQLNTALFSYEPVLRQLKDIKELSLEEDILHWEKKKTLQSPAYQLSNEILSLLSSLERDFSRDLQERLSLRHPTRLDESQAACFLAGLRQRLSLIQGPPGTGKSFIGSLIAKAIHDHSCETILVVCYTHHALDQFLEDLLDMDIPAAHIVRLGSAKKATVRTRPLSLNELRSSVKLSQIQWAMLNIRKQEVTEESQNLQNAVDAFRNTSVSKSDLLEFLEFQSDGPPYFAAFQVPEEEHNMARVGRRGKAVDSYYLLDRWCRGKDRGIYRKPLDTRVSQVWQMKPQSRNTALDTWKSEILKERVGRALETGGQYNVSINQIDSIWMEKDLKVIREKRVIGCTTTAAAKYVQALQAISPGVLLVEEAGEILESHILTALGPETKQVVLIGDHKQLRPKVHYDLSVEKGDGYDLNRSLFERLVLKGYPHTVLSQQHRMRPELSAIIRQLTYPDLVDAPSTRGRPDLRGLQDNLIFFNHNEPEDELPDIPDWKDNTSTSSKKNIFEAKMTLKCVRYLGQQGYGTNNIVVLTPYLGQLRLLLDELGKDNDPVLNDLDSYDLVRAGLMPAASADMNKPRIRISTIDNYQGEESDIVIVSLTRSNARRDIGFMSAPERLNVMLSRARDALLIIGDAETFMGSRRGKELWEHFMSILKAGNHIYDGLPVKCQRHPNRKTLLRRPEEFDEHCPDGGCFEPCGVALNCGVHLCPQRCHQLHDHSKMPCEYILEFTCGKGHAQKQKCHTMPPGMCRICQVEDERRQRELQAELERQAKRDQEQAEHAAKMADLDRQIRLVREEAADGQAAEERLQALEQKMRDLEGARRLAKGASNTVPKTTQEATAAGSIPPAARPATVAKPRSDRKQQNSKRVDQNQTEEMKCAPEKEWDRQKRVDGAQNASIDALMALTGLEDVKSKVLSIKSKVETVLRQGTDMKKERLGIVLLGNPGTGKTTVARLYAQFLASVGVLPGTEFIETTGSRLANEGVPGAKKHLEKILTAGGGAFFLDEAYQLADGRNPGNTTVLDFLLAEIENQVGKIVFILAGYNKEMEKFFEHNSGLDSRLPHRLHFADYSDQELLVMLRRLIEKKYKNRAKVEDGVNGLYARIAVRRLGRGRGREGYGNARALENVWAKISERQADRLQQERVAGAMPDDFLFTQEDLIGPEPSSAIRTSAAWKKLHGLIGLKSVKESIEGLVERIQLNYKRELDEMPPIEVSLNRVFLGSPGTGKTSVGKLYGEILADMGLLSKREVILKNPADFLGSVLGESEKNTKAILKASEGKVLIIDEAYMLYSGGKGAGNTSDPYKTAVIDTIVAEVQSTPGEDRCVLLLGYKEQMEEMLENSNPGLARRFQLSYAFQFEDFDDEQLKQILDLKLHDQGLDATEEAKRVAIGVLSRARDRPNFGNAGDVENLISYAKAQEQKRRSAEGSKTDSAEVVFLPQDFDEEFDRVESAALNCRKLFADVVGCEGLINKLEGYQRINASMRARDRDPRTQIPFNFIFKGPPGTGKTTTARKIGQVFYDMGLLSTKEYVDCSASDLVAQYVGQTGPKTVSVLKRGLGKVLFIDEAYRLGEGQFAKEAIDELVDSLTKPQFFGKLVVILAGYTENMNSLLSVNPGLSSRFPEEIIFQNMSAGECLTLLRCQLDKAGIECCLDNRQSGTYSAIVDRLNKLSSLPGWANGRDVQTLSKGIAGTAFASAESAATKLTVSNQDVLAALDKMYNEQKARFETQRKPTAAETTPKDLWPQPYEFLTNAFSQRTTAPAKSSAAKLAEPAPVVIEENAEQEQRSHVAPEEAQRDPDVSDAIWAQLQADMQANELAEQQSQNALADLQRQVESAAANDGASRQAATALEEAAKAKAKAGDGEEEEENERKRRHEEARLRALAAYRAKQAAEDKLRRARQEAEKKRKEEAEAQKKLRHMGVCPAGFGWVKQDGGYRCRGGSHFVSNGQLGM